MRVKFTIILLSLLSFSLIGSGLFHSYLSQRERAAALDEKLRDALKDLREAVARDETSELFQDFKSEGILWLWRKNPKSWPRSTAAQTQALIDNCSQEGWSSFTSDDYYLRCLTKHHAEGQAQLTVGVLRSRGSEPYFQPQFFGVYYPAMILFGLIIALITSHWFFKPIRLMNAQFEFLIANFKPEDIESARARFNDSRKKNSRLWRDDFSDLTDSFAEFLSRVSGSLKRTEDHAARLAHEINTPLTIMKAKISEFENIGDSGDARPASGENYTSLKTQIERLGDFVKSYLNWSEKNLKIVETSNELYSIELYSFVEEVIESMLPVHGGRVVLLREENAATGVIANPHDLEHYLQNFVTNAVKYGPVGEVITIKVTSSGLTVHDKGEGLPLHVREKIGQPFNKGEKNSVRPGSGMGLAVNIAIAEKYGWSVDFSSASAEGFTISTTFN